MLGTAQTLKQQEQALAAGEAGETLALAGRACSVEFLRCWLTSSCAQQVVPASFGWCGPCRRRRRDDGDDGGNMAWGKPGEQVGRGKALCLVTTLCCLQMLACGTIFGMPGCLFLPAAAMNPTSAGAGGGGAT